MALQVSYVNRIGYYTYKWQNRSYKVWFCHANALCAMIHFYRDEKDGKRVDMTQLMGFFVDLKHANNCIKDNFFSQCSGFTFFAKELDDDLWKMVRLMAKNGIKVTIK